MDQNAEQQMPPQVVEQPANQPVGVSTTPKVSVAKVLFIFLGVIVLLAIAGGSYYLGTQQKSQSNNNSVIEPLHNAVQKNDVMVPSTVMTQQAVATSIPTPTSDPTASWQQFSNTQYKFSIRHPYGLSANEQTTYYYYVEFKDPTATGTLPPYVVSVIPDTFVAKDVAAYNYMSSDWINNISNIPVGGTKTMDQAASYTRLIDMTVDGIDAVSIKVHATGYNQIRTYVKKNGYIYMISNYYQSDAMLNDFTLFVSSFKFLQ